MNLKPTPSSPGFGARMGIGLWAALVLALTNACGDAKPAANAQDSSNTPEVSFQIEELDHKPTPHEADPATAPAAATEMGLRAKTDDQTATDAPAPHTDLDTSSCSPRISTDLKASLLTGDWRTVCQQLESSARPPREQTAVDRIHQALLAHSFLALNRNDESTAGFLALTEPSGRSVWNEWTTQFVADHPTTAVAHYLRGDALARNEAWSQAGVEFGRALECDPEFALAFNARAVIRAIEGDYDGSLTDLHHASRLAPDLADAHANRGFVWIRQSAGAVGALASLDRAVELSPHFAAAHYGRACLLWVLGRWDEIGPALEAAENTGDELKPLLAEYLIHIHHRTTLASDPSDALAHGDNPSMELSRNLSDLNRGKMGSLDKAIKLTAKYPDLKGQLNAGINTILSQKPELRNGIADRLTDMRISKTQGFSAVAANMLKSVDVSANAGTKTKNPRREHSLGGGMQVNLGAIGNAMANHNQKVLDVTNNLTNTFGLTQTTKPRGFKTQIDSRFFDHGDWPFLPFHGLLWERSLPSGETDPGEEQ